MGFAKTAIKRLSHSIPTDRWAIVTFAAIFVAGLTIVMTFRDYGSTWDERCQEELGRDVVAWFSSGGSDVRALSGGSAGNLHLYGGIFEAVAELTTVVLPFDRIETRHLVNAIVALLGIAGVALLATRLGGNRAAFFGASLLLATPFWWGHGFANSKDIPFAAAYPWLLLALLNASDEFPRPRLRGVLMAGSALGAGLAVRPGSLILLLPLSAAIFGVRLLPVLLRASPRDRVGITAAVLVRFTAIVGLGWLGMLAFWPYGLHNPISGPAAAVAAARGFQLDIPVRFAGEWFPSNNLPRLYVPTLFLATLPETWLATAFIGAIVAVIAWWRDNLRPALEVTWLDPALVAVAGFGPIFASVMMRPVLYDGIRHFIFVLPALAAVAGLVLSTAVDRFPLWGGRATISLIAGLAALAVVDAVRLHPYQYIYYNRAIAGGLPGASGNYEMDYWGATGREAMAWVVRNVKPLPGRQITVGTTADSFVAAHWIEQDPALRGSFPIALTEPPDLRLATTRWFSHRATGKVLHVVERMGVPLLYVIDTSVKSNGVLTLEAGDRAVMLTLPLGWFGVPELKPWDERARYLLCCSEAEQAQIKALIITPRTGTVPSLEQLRIDVTDHAASMLGVSLQAIDPQPVVGTVARGWIAIGDAASAQPPPFVGAAAVVVGDTAVILLAQYSGDTSKTMPELLEVARSAQLTVENRRVP